MDVSALGADWFARNEITIDVPPSVVWRHLVSAADWSQWYPAVGDVEFLNGVDQLLDQDTPFTFSTIVGRIHAVVDEFVPYSRLAWSGGNAHLRVGQVWQLLTVAGGCHVITEQAAVGAGAIAIRTVAPRALDENHELWMTALKRISERVR